MPRLPVRSLRWRFAFWFGLFFTVMAVGNRYLHFLLAVDLLARDVDAQLLGEMMIGAPGFLLPLVQDQRAQASEAAATAALPASLDRWWEATLGKVVATALHDKVSPRTAAAPADEAAPVR